jgi:hypothetical protein
MTKKYVFDDIGLREFVNDLDQFWAAFEQIQAERLLEGIGGQQ